MTLTGKNELLGGNLSQCHYVHHKYYMGRSDIATRPSRWEFGVQRPERRRKQEYCQNKSM